MRFVTFDVQGIETVGVRDGDDVVDLRLAAPDLPQTLLDLVRTNALEAAYSAAMAAGADARRSVGDLRYLPLIPRPPKFFGMGINYPSHVGERPETPGYFLSGPTRLCAHGEPMIVPAKSRTLDYETELAFVISRRARNVKAEDALDYIAGYTVFNDASVRGHGSGITLSLMKNSDKTGPLGPELVTPDELPPGGDGLMIRTRRNGELVQEDSTSKMFWNVAEIIALCSSFMSFEPGDVITTGTCGGTVVDRYTERGQGKESEDLPYLRDGEVVESEIEGIGVLRNPVVAEPR